jgi:anaerobic selenocysteine-containing dehydrogenase
MRVHLTDRIRPDVVSLPHGWWQPEEQGPDFGIFDVCANVLLGSDQDACDPILGSSPLKAMLCEVRPAHSWPDRPKGIQDEQGRLHDSRNRKV